jgi:hypothetical protein
VLRFGGRAARFTLRSAAIAGLTAGALAVSMGPSTPVQAATPSRHSAPRPAATPSVKNVTAVAPHFVATHSQATTVYRPTSTAWPTAGTSLAAVGGTAAAAATTSQQATASARSTGPVTVQPVAPTGGRYAGPSDVQITVLSRASAAKAGVDGVLFSLTPRGAGHGTAKVSLDYSSFAQAYGAGFGSRLQLVELPACALTTPQLAVCEQQTPVRSTNNTGGRTLSAEIPLTGTAASAGPVGLAPATRGSAAQSPAAATIAPMVLAAETTATAGDGGGPAGSYTATTLKPAGSWSEGGSSGSFTYSYPLPVPPAASTLVPGLSLDYDSGSVDGQTAASQAQSSWIGDGWSLPQSYIEQSYTSCADSPEGSASPSSTGDECWDGWNLTLSLDGTSTALVYDAAKGTFTPQDGSGDVVTHVTDSGNGSKTYNTDYWTVTERNGMVFSFGRNELPGWASGKATTNSVDYTQVYSAHSGDPCYSSSGFSSSGCLMAYRWNLDYVKDIHGDAMSYFYDQDTNEYGKDNTTTPVTYIRDSYLDHIDYGFTDGNAYSTTVPDVVKFGTGDRCVLGASSCDPLSSTTEANWPDTPFDLICSSSTSCSSHSPSYFSTVRLTSVATSQYSVAKSTYVPVDSWALDQTMPVTGDGYATLWLQSITHTGSDAQGGGSATAITLPSETFGAVDLQNRVNSGTDGLPPLYRFRISTITSETGSVTGVDYELTNPCTSPVTITPSANTSSCYPVYWTPQGYTAPILDWFNKYAVQEVTQSDPTGGAPEMATSYKYLDPAWHFDDEEVVQAKYRTYGQWRGYAYVTTYTGDGVNNPQTESEVHYYQGMSDDNDTTAVSVTDSQNGTHPDLDQLAGQELESTGYLGSGGPVDHSTITSYWVSPAIATQSQPGLPALTANSVGTDGADRRRGHHLARQRDRHDLRRDDRRPRLRDVRGGLRPHRAGGRGRRPVHQRQLRPAQHRAEPGRAAVRQRGRRRGLRRLHRGQRQQRPRQRQHPDRPGLGESPRAGRRRDPHLLRRPDRRQDLAAAHRSDVPSDGGPHTGPGLDQPDRDRLHRWRLHLADHHRPAVRHPGTSHRHL